MHSDFFKTEHRAFQSSSCRENMNKKFNVQNAKIFFSLAGKSCRDKYSYDRLTNQEKFFQVEDYVKQYFSDKNCDLYFDNQDKLLDETRPYPFYFASAWVVRLIDSKVKQLVIVVHGETMADAIKKLRAKTKEINWC